MGYCEYVKEALEGKAEVYWHTENARFAEYVLYSIGNWEHNLRLGKDLACVHWNVGLHDVIRTAGEEPMTPPDIYAYFIDRICKRLKSYYPEAKFVFATTTPVQEELYDFWFARKNADIDAINEKAVQVVKSHGMDVNDFAALLKDCDDSMHSDLTHFNTPKANELMTKAVLKSVCPALGIDYDSLTMPDFSVIKIASDDVLK